MRPGWSILLVAASALLLAGLLSWTSSDGEAANVLDNVTLEQDTVLTGQWHIHNGLKVNRCRLTLDNATLKFSSEWFFAELNVDFGGTLIARNSVLDSNGSDVVGVFRGYSSWYNCTLMGSHEPEWVGFTFTHLEPGVIYRDCTFLLWTIHLSGVATVQNCSFEGLDTSVYCGIYDTDRDDWIPMEVLVENCTFDTRGWVAGISSSGWRVGPRSNVTVRHCDFTNLSVGMYAENMGFEVGLLVHDITTYNCYTGVRIESGGRDIVVRDSFLHARIGMSLSISDAVAPEVRDLSVYGASNGITSYTIGVVQNLTRVSITADWGVTLLNGRAAVVDSVVNGTVLDFQVVVGTLEVINTTHGGKARVEMFPGEVVTYADMTVTNVSWDNGPETELEDLGELEVWGNNGTKLGRVVAPLPRHLKVRHWWVNDTLSLTFEHAWAVLRGGGADFRSLNFSVVDGSSVWISMVDHVAPELVITTPAEGLLQNTTTLPVNGRVEELGSGIDRVLVAYGGAPWQPAMLDSRGGFSILLKLPGDGMFLVYVNASDKTGLWDMGMVANISIDTTAPFIKVLGPSPWSNRVQVTLEGRTELGSQLWVDDTPVPVRHWGKFEHPLTLSEGFTTVHIRAVDMAGNENRTTYTIELDQLPPSIVVHSPEDGAYLPTREVQVSGATEPTARVLVNGEEATREGDGFSVTLYPREGRFFIEVFATDRAGNVGELALEVTIDLTPPGLAVEHPVDGAMTTEANITVSGLLSEANPTRLTVNGVPVPFAGGSWSTEYSLKEGRNELWVRAEDDAGHLVLVVVNVTLDTRSPNVDITLTIGTTDHERPEGTIRTREQHGNLTVNLDEPASLVVYGIFKEDVPKGRTSVELQFLEDATTTVRIQAVDAAGNAAPEVVFEVFVDRRPPLMELHGVVDDAIVSTPSILVMGTTEPGANLAVEGKDVPLSVNGSFRLTLELVKGTNHFNFTVEDDVGNTAIHGLTLHYVPEDEEPPVDVVPLIWISLTLAVIVALPIVYWIYKRGRF